MPDKNTVTKISRTTLAWLRERATRNHRSVPGELDAIRELLDGFSIDTLPHPEGGQVVPVIKMEEKS